MKTCGRCKKVKDKGDFYRRGSNGLMSVCKVCSREQEREKRLKNPEVWRAKGRRNYRNHKVHIAEKRKAWYQRSQDKHAAHVKVAKAIRKGDLVRLPCEDCGRVDSLAHHDDYSKPLDVRWLCPTHHMRLHFGVV